MLSTCANFLKFVQADRDHQQQGVQRDRLRHGHRDPAAASSGIFTIWVEQQNSKKILFKKK